MLNETALAEAAHQAPEAPNSTHAFLGSGFLCGVEGCGLAAAAKVHVIAAAASPAWLPRAIDAAKGVDRVAELEEKLADAGRKLEEFAIEVETLRAGSIVPPPLSPEAKGAHTPGPWRETATTEGARFGAIIADSESGCDDEYNVRAYGGHVICETVSAQNRPLILAAPELFGALVDSNNALTFLFSQLDCTSDPNDVATFTRVLAANRAALVKAGLR